MATTTRKDYIVTVKLNSGEVKHKEINAATAYMAVSKGETQFAKEGIRKVDYTDPVGTPNRRINITATNKA